MCLMTTMCQLLRSPTGGYCEWCGHTQLDREIEDPCLIDRICEIQTILEDPCGAPMIHAELSDRGIDVGRKRVAHLMRVVPFPKYQG